MAARLDVHVVTHTHWDREWYLPAGRFRQRLVELVDALLEDGPGSVLLDGQVVVLDDYLSVRPERREALAARLREGTLEAGPWYVLADELIPGGESLVRNLLAGRRVLRSLGAESPPVLYSPDAFGHPGALPTLAAGFGLPLIILWRGLGGGRAPAGDTLRWRAPGRAEALLFHLPRSGYEYASNLPTAEAASAAWWRRAREELGARSATGVLLLLNGADHHAPQHDLDAALAALERAAAPDVIRRSTLREFAAALIARAGASELPAIEGELRDSYGYSWTLQGTLASRAHQKRDAATVERLLLREAEPWSALASGRGGRDRARLVEAAWRTLLLCHPHDTLCGCSSDEVARAMDTRVEDALTQARGVIEDAVLDLARHDRGAARVASDRWANSVLIRNPAARPRGGIAEVELARVKRRVPVGPASAGFDRREAPATDLGIDDGRVPFQLLERETRHDRIESPEHYPQDDLVEVHRGVAWLGPLPGYGVGVLPVATSRGGANAASHPTVSGQDRVLENEHLRVEVTPDGSIRLTSLADGRAIASLVSLHDVGDAGDLYTHSRVEPEVAATHPAAVELLHAGPLRAALRTSWAIDIPAASTRDGRSRTWLRQNVEVTLALDAGATALGLHVRGANVARDHRLRIVLSSGIDGGTAHADAAFGPVRREPIAVRELAPPIEAAPPTAPLHRYVTVANDRAGMTLISDGLAEYEVTDGGAIAVTLVRAVGELSRDDIPERPGHAGWPVPTPDAQALRPFAARLALFPHGPRDAATIAAIERAAEERLLPLAGTPFRSALSAPQPVLGVELEGEGLACSAVKQSEDGAWLVLRCTNLLERSAGGRWRVGLPLSEARLARLDETPLEPIPVREGVIELELPPRGVATVLAR